MPSGNTGGARHVEKFKNEPHTDFSRAANRDAMAHALQEVAEELGGEYPLVINGKATDTRSQIVSRNPSDKDQIVGQCASATADHAEKAIEAAGRAWTQWRKVSSDHRAEYIELMASEMVRRRFELAAWMVYESGKPWVEADADVAEAIDFCRYYAACMRELDSPLACDFAGEENRLTYRSRGVAVVIAPWNFPLAILMGMTAAALVTGNTVVMKPAEQSSVVAAKIVEMARQAGFPDGVLNYLPGDGEVVGPVLVEHPDVEIVAFTGSRAVGLKINESAAVVRPGQINIKRVIAEMGGKNAIIIDGDADLDEAVQAVVHSAFGYAGQKCSACSRLIIVEDAYDLAIERLKHATESLTIGPASDPGTDVGPVIDEEAFARINDYIAIGKDECTTILETDPSEVPSEGYFIGPHIFGDVEPDSRLVTEEIFGPVLAVQRASDFDEALNLAGATDYALTGGVFSRSPEHLKQAREEFLVGNLYLNRGITGALVQRHPFGGLGMSGIGTKAGGPDYLLQYLVPVNISENTLRRGFAPAPDDD